MTRQQAQKIINEHLAASDAYEETCVLVGAHHPTDSVALAWLCLRAGAYRGDNHSHPETVTLIGGVHDGVKVDCQFPL